MSVTVRKRSSQRARDFYDHVVRPHKPLGLAFITSGCDEDWLEYELAQGRYPSTCEDVEQVLEDLDWAVWSSGEELKIDADQYIRHCEQLVIKQRQFVWHECRRVIEKRAVQATRVAHWHGDMTLANCVITQEDKTVFFDPAEHRGMPCRELDEAKIMQSLSGYDVLDWGASRLQHYFYFDWTPLHYALLGSHLLRLMPHQRARGRADLAEWAESRLRNVELLLRRWS